MVPRGTPMALAGGAAANCTPPRDTEGRWDGGGGLGSPDSGLGVAAGGASPPVGEEEEEGEDEAASPADDAAAGASGFSILSMSAPALLSISLARSSLALELGCPTAPTAATGRPPPAATPMPPPGRFMCGMWMWWWMVRRAAPGLLRALASALARLSRPEETRHVVGTYIQIVK